MTVKNLYPNIEPSLSLDFANTKALDPRITFARASTARFYDGKTVAKAEENLFLRSEEFDNAAWAPAFTTVTTNATTAPDGTTTAEAVIPTATANAHWIAQNQSIVTGVTYTTSFFVKAFGYSFFQFAATTGFGTTDYINFNLSTGTVGNKSGTWNETITDAGNGWYRVSITRTGTSTGTGGTFYHILDADTASRAPSYLANGTDGIYMWGAQHEIRSSVTAYTPTTTQPITNYVPVLQSAANNVARFDHNPTTGESLGLLIEEQRTNLFQRSQEFDNAYWGKENSSVLSNVAIAPDGTLTADKIVEDTANAEHYVWRQVTASGDHSLSVYAKAAERGFLAINFFTSGGNRITWFNLTNGTVGTNAAGNTASITPVGNGWYRCTVSRVGGGSGTFHEFRTATADNTTSYAGDGYSGIYIWGAQLEAGAFPTSYIPTVASQVTRSADAASMTGANFSSWYRADEGTLYAESANFAPSSLSRVLSISGGNISNMIEANYDLTNFRFTVFASGAAQAQIDTAVTNTNVNKIAGSYKVNDFASSVNGNTAGTDASGIIPVVNIAHIGNRVDGTRSLNGHIKKLAYYPLRLTDAQLQALTQN